VIEPETPERFHLLEEREVPMKGLGGTRIREIHNTGMWLPSYSAENRAVDGLYELRRANRYWPRWQDPEPSAGEFSHVRPLDPDVGS